LGEELAAVQEYLRLEQARFGGRLQVAVYVGEALHGVPVASQQLLGVVRAAVQEGIEPRPEGGVLTLTARSVVGGCEVRVTGGDGPDTTLVLPP
jgi:LytS/YehU family sensor histidine kinase